MAKAIKNMLYVVELKKGFRKVGEMRIEIDPYSLDKYGFDDSSDIMEVVENCDSEMIDIEKAINSQMADIRAHLKRLTNIDEVNCMAKDRAEKLGCDPEVTDIKPTSKEGKKHHEKLEKKWKKAEKKHSKKGKK